MILRLPDDLLTELFTQWFSLKEWWQLDKACIFSTANSIIKHVVKSVVYQHDDVSNGLVAEKNFLFLYRRRGRFRWAVSRQVMLQHLMVDYRHHEWSGYKLGALNLSRLVSIRLQWPPDSVLNELLTISLPKLLVLDLNGIKGDTLKLPLLSRLQLLDLWFGREHKISLVDSTLLQCSQLQRLKLSSEDALQDEDGSGVLFEQIIQNNSALSVLRVSVFACYPQTFAVIASALTQLCFLDLEVRSKDDIGWSALLRIAKANPALRGVSIKKTIRRMEIIKYIYYREGVIVLTNIDCTHVLMELMITLCKGKPPRVARLDGVQGVTLSLAQLVTKDVIPFHTAVRGCTLTDTAIDYLNSPGCFLDSNGDECWRRHLPTL